MRAGFLPYVLLLLTPAMFAQTTLKPPAGSDWSRVQNLAVGTDIRVSSKHFKFGGPIIVPHSQREYCIFVSASDAELLCNRTDKIFFFPIHRQFRFQREEVASVRVTRSELSAFVGAAIGVGAGAGLVGGVAATNSETDHSEDVLAYALVGMLGGFIGAGVGKATDFMGGPTIYRAP
jgi:hypothetical protein